MNKVLRLSQFEQLQESEYQGKKQYKQWCSFSEGTKTYSVLLTHSGSTGFEINDVGRYFNIHLLEERIAKSGKPYHFGFNNGRANGEEMQSAGKDKQSKSTDTSELQTCLVCATKLAAAGKINITEIQSIAKAMYKDMFGSSNSVDTEPAETDKEFKFEEEDLPF